MGFPLEFCKGGGAQKLDPDRIGKTISRSACIACWRASKLTLSGFMCVTVRHRLRLQRKIIIIFIIYLLNTQLKLTVVMQASRTERHTVLLTYAHNITSTVKRNIHSTIHGIGVTRNLIISTEVWILASEFDEERLTFDITFSASMWARGYLPESRSGNRLFTASSQYVQFASCRSVFTVRR